MSLLPSWHDRPARRAITDFVAAICGDDGSEPVPGEERIAVFDNDGTLWCEKPTPIQLDFIFRRLVEMVGDDPTLASDQPWKAAHEQDYAWFGQAMDEHYAGDDAKTRVMTAGILAAFGDMSVDDFEARTDRFLRSAEHPTLTRSYLECAYRPMVELMDYLDSNGFTNYIASGGGRDFVRPISQEIYGIPRERVIGSAVAVEYSSDEHGGRIVRKPEADYLDDGPQKPVQIWNRTGRRPLLAGGNSNGDVPMLQFTQHEDKPFLRLLVLHNDAEREFEYTAGAEGAIEEADANGWTVVSIKDDWTTVFGS